MSIRPDEQQVRWQVLAEQAEREGRAAGNDRQVDRYRLVVRALRQPVMHTLPADFAARVLLKIAHAEERSGLEDALMTGLMLALAIVGLVVLQPFVGAVVAMFRISVPALPWPLLVGSALSIGAAFAIDHLWLNRRPATA